MKEYNFNNYAGCVTQRRSKKTGTLYGVYHGAQSGIDITSKWVTLCEKHTTFVSSTTLNLAKQLVTDPDEWCQKCRDKIS